MTALVNTETGEIPFPSWTAKDQAAGNLLAEAAGWGKGVDASDDDDLLAWAREYLPRIVKLSGTPVVRR